jgi:hypothetical protein
MNDIKNLTKSDITVLGNGVSINKLTNDQKILINSNKIFRCNWFFQDKSSINNNITGWFHNIPGGFNELLDKLNSSNRTMKYIFAPSITENHKQRLAKKKFKFISSWDISKNSSVVAKKHLKPKKERGNLNLPTTGINMFHFTCLLNPKNVHLCGIDMYQQGTKENSDFSKFKYDDPYLMKCKPHDLKTDIMFIIDGCIHIQFKSKIIIYHCPFFQKIINIIFDELTPYKITKHRNDYTYIKNLANLVYNKII